MESPSVLITGASRGIGREIAVKYAQKGYRLYLTSHNSEEELQSLCYSLQNEYQVSCTGFHCDMGDYKQVESVFQSIPTLSILVNNAGISYVGLLQDMTPKEWDRIVATNLSSAFYTSKFAIPLMLSLGQGQIINVSSVWGAVGASTEVAYSATKGGLNSFTKALAKELAPSNIRVNAIACGLIDTSMNSHLSNEEIEQLCEEIPMGRSASAKEVSEMIWQISSSPSYLTGQVISFDGGWFC